MNATKFLSILAISLLLAGYAAWIRSERPPMDRDERTIPATDIPLIRLAEAESLWRKGSTIFVDVRAPADYSAGHIAGAINLPEEDFEERFRLFKARLDEARAIVVYCNNRDCGKSLWSALRLRRQGLTQTRIFPEGWHDWIGKGLPTAVAATR